MSYADLEQPRKRGKPVASKTRMSVGDHRKKTVMELEAELAELDANRQSYESQYPDIEKLNHPKPKNRPKVEETVQARVDNGISRDLPSRERREVRAAYRESEVIRRENEQLRRQLAAMYDTEKVTELENQVTARDLMISNLQHEVRLLRRIHQQQEKVMGDADDTEKQFLGKLEHLQEECRVLRMKMKKYKDIHELESRTIHSQQQQVIKLQRDLDNASAKIAQYQKLTRGFDPEVVQRELDDNKKKIDELEKKLRLSEHTAETTINKLKSQHKDGGKALKDLSERANTLEHQLADKDKESRAHAVENKKLTRQLAAAKKAAADAQHAAGEFKESAEAEAAKVKELEAKVVRLEAAAAETEGAQLRRGFSKGTVGYAVSPTEGATPPPKMPAGEVVSEWAGREDDGQYTARMLAGLGTPPVAPMDAKEAAAAAKGAGAAADAAEAARRRVAALRGDTGPAKAASGGGVAGGVRRGLGRSDSVRSSKDTDAVPELEESVEDMADDTAGYEDDFEEVMSGHGSKALDGDDDDDRGRRRDPDSERDRELTEAVSAAISMDQEDDLDQIGVIRQDSSNGAAVARDPKPKTSASSSRATSRGPTRASSVTSKPPSRAPSKPGSAVGGNKSKPASKAPSKAPSASVSRRSSLANANLKRQSSVSSISSASDSRAPAKPPIAGRRKP